MATVEFTGHDLVVWFKENPSNGQEWQYRIRYECANETVIHYIKHNEEQSNDPDGMRVYKDVLTFEENRAAGLTRSPKVFMATQDASGTWTPDAIEAEIDAYNPPPAPPVMFYSQGIDGIAFDFDKPLDPDFAGIALWADTQLPVRKDRVTSKYIGPNTKFTLSLAEGTQYYVTYAAYDSFGDDLLLETTKQLATLPRDSFLLPILREAIEPVQALTFKTSDVFTKLHKSYDVKATRTINIAEERLGLRIDQNGNLIAEKVLELGSSINGVQANLDLVQRTLAGKDEALAQQILTLATKVDTDKGANAASLQEERTVRSTKDDALARDILALAATVSTDKGNFQAALQVEREVRANTDEAISREVSTLGAKLAGDAGALVEAAIVSERTARVDADSALTLRLDQQASKIGDNESQFNDRIKTLVDADGALAQRITDQAALWNSDISGQILAATRTLNENIANGDYALSQRIDQFSATFGGLSSAIQSETQARADADGALGRRIDAISVTDQSGAIATIQQQMQVQTNAINGLNAQYTLRIDNNGVISGFGLASNNGVSEFVISADRFQISHYAGRMSPFYVVGGNVYIADAVIERATIGEANIRDLSINGQKLRPYTVTQSSRWAWDGHNSDFIPSESSGLAMASLCQNTQYQWVTIAPAGPIQCGFGAVPSGSRALITFSICCRQTGSNDDAYKFRIIRDGNYVLPTQPFMSFITGKAIAQSFTFIDDNLGDGNGATDPHTYQVQALRPGNQAGRLLSASLVAILGMK